MKSQRLLKISLGISLLIGLSACAKSEEKKKAYSACSAQVVADYQAVMIANQALDKMVNLSINIKSIALETQEAKAVCEEALARHSDKNYPCMLTDEETTYGIGRAVIPSYCESINQTIEQFKTQEYEVQQQQNTVQLN